MGWAGATDLFDNAVSVTLDFLDRVHPSMLGSQPPILVKAVVEAHYKSGWDDWDTQDESHYFEPYLHDVMVELGEIDPEES